MKKNHFIFVALLLSAGIIAACKKNTYKISERTEVSNSALVKIGFFAGSKNNPSMQMKVDGNRVSPSLIYNTPFPGGGLNTLGSNHSDYLTFTPGEHTISFSIPKVGTNIDSVAVLEKKFDLSTGKQTIFLADSMPNITTYLVKDAADHPTDSGKVRVKFVNLLPNVAAIDFYRNTELVAANVPFNGVAEYKDIFAGNANFWILSAGTNDTLNTTRAINMGAGRIYTLFSRGYKGGTGTLVPHISAMIVE